MIYLYEFKVKLVYTENSHLPRLHSETVSKIKQETKNKINKSVEAQVWKIAQSKCLPQKHEDMSSMPCMHIQMQANGVIITPVPGRQRQGILVVHWLVSLDKLVKSRPMRSLVSKGSR